MDRERLIQYFSQNYMPRREMLSRLPLGLPPDEIWQEIDAHRRSRATVLPLRDAKGEQLWFVLTDEMIRSSEKIVEEAMQPPSNGESAVLEEAYYTSFLEGSDMTVDEALAFTNRNGAPENIREQLLLNNKRALQYASENALRLLNDNTICTISGILTDGLDEGGATYRSEDTAEIASMGAEPYRICRAAEIPGMMGELCAYVNDPNIHPLLKAAVAHAWLIAIRPFPEGNERLARMVAYMLLLRAQYTFFREVPISGLIAQDGYGYFEALANTLREWDMTYMVEYYICVLGRAIDEIHQRRLDEEAERAKQPLKPPEPGNVTQLQIEYSDNNAKDTVEETLAQAGFETVEINKSALSYEEIHSALEEFVSRGSAYSTPIAKRMLAWLKTGKMTFTRNELCDGIVPSINNAKGVLLRLRERGVLISVGLAPDHTMEYAFNLAMQKSVAEKPPNQEPDEIDEPLDYNELHYRLMQIASRNKLIGSPIARRLLEWLETDRYTFTAIEICDGLVPAGKQTQNVVLHFREKKIIVAAGTKRGHFTEYMFNLDRTDGGERKPVSDTDGESGNMLSDSMDRQQPAGNDPRIGNIADKPLSAEDTDFVRELKILDEHKAAQFCKQTGLDLPTTPIRYHVTDPLQMNITNLDEVAKHTVSELFDCFNNAFFTGDMLVSRLNYTEAKARTVLHEFTLRGILNCLHDGQYYYWFNISPDKHPECFERAA